jgi:hypothetical protein
MKRSKLMSRCAPVLLGLFGLVGMSACVNFAFPSRDAYELQGPGLPDPGPGRDGVVADEERIYPESLQGLDPNYCAYDNSGLLSLASSALFEAEAFEPDGDLFSSIAALCEPIGVGPERALRLDAPIGTELRVRLLADWSGVFTLSHDGCRAGHVIACGQDELREVLDSERHYLFLERSEGSVIPSAPGGIDLPDGVEGSETLADTLEPDGAYALQIALNHVGGYGTCPVQREISASAFDALPLLADPVDGCYREALVLGDTRIERDRFFVTCTGATAGVDSFGGAPDHAILLNPDFSDGKARRADLRLETGSDWDGILSVSGSPCGAPEAVIDCDHQPEGVHRVNDLLLLPGAPVHVVVDGIGEHAPEGRAAGPFTLALRVYEDCL